MGQKEETVRQIIELFNQFFGSAIKDPQERDMMLKAVLEDAEKEGGAK